MYPTDRGGPDGDETLDWLWDLEGFDVGAVGAGVEDVAAAAPNGVKKHLRKSPVPADDSAADEFATALFALDPPTGPVNVPPGLPEITPATIVSPAISPMDEEYVRRSRRPLMAVAALLVIGLGTGVALAVSGGGGKNHVAQSAKVAVSPTTTETTAAAPTTTIQPPPADTTTVPTTVVPVVSPPPGTTTVPRMPTTRPCVRLLAFFTATGDTTTTAATTTTVPATTTTVARTTTVPRTTAPPTTPPHTAPPPTSPPKTSPPPTAPHC